ncbi:hypothetical protein H0H93_000443 [Arthromyces matolae]|nr:hypothetical protein H0H93_000443 [Arthromyces matolae]
MADVESPIAVTHEGVDTGIDDGEEAESKEIMLMKQRVAEMEKEAQKLRELQAAADSSATVGSEDHAMETEEDKTMADNRSIYVGNVQCIPFKAAGAGVVDIEVDSEDIKATARMREGTSLHTFNMFNVWKMASRPLSTAARSKPSKYQVPDYPFSKTAIIPNIPPPSPPKSLLKGKGLMQHLNKTLATPAKQEMFNTLFDRHSSSQIKPGSIIQLTLEHAPTTFTGVLIGIRRRGLDTSILLRNIIQRTGVEMQFFVNSPHVKDIKILQQPPRGRMRRAKLFYLRDSPEKMSMIAGGRR